MLHVVLKLLLALGRDQKVAISISQPVKKFDHRLHANRKLDPRWDDAHAFAVFYKVRFREAICFLSRHSFSNFRSPVLLDFTRVKVEDRVS